MLCVVRSVVLCALAAYSESGRCINGQVRCLDALGATGVAGLTWAHQVPKVSTVLYLYEITLVVCSRYHV